jgi:uncharacterized protein YceH (UPF0502 family)
MEDLLRQLNEKDNEVLNNKAILYTTDWEVIKATGLGIELSASIRAIRTEARAAINQLEVEIAELKEQIDSYVEPEPIE